MFWKTIRFAKRNPGDHPGGTCDISCDLLVAKLLGQYSKEQRANEAREKELKQAEENAEKEKKEAELKALQEEIAQHELFLEGKVKLVSELLSKLTEDDKEAVSRTFLAMSSSSECCVAIRQSRCLPVLIGLIHGEGSTRAVREQASKALHNIVLHGAENKQGRREAIIYKLIEQLLKYCERLENTAENPVFDLDEVPNAAQNVALLMKFSFNEEYRHAMGEFGALHTFAKLIVTDHLNQGGEIENLPSESVAIRRYAAMALTNLTYRDSNNKAQLCSYATFMQVLVAQLDSPNEDLCQVTASVLRNLSWRADSVIKKILRDMDSIIMLMKTAVRVQKETTLKAILSAIWNLSAHSNLNKVDICNVDGAIEYLVKMLNYQAPSGTYVIVENVGGIFRNISNLIAVRDDYRVIIRNYNCLYVLLHHLTSASQVVVSNACGTLWNLSARCAEDQSTLISLGAIEMLRSLTHSKSKMISIASAAALKNLVNSRLDANVVVDESRGDGTLLVRKRRALEQEINARLRQTSDIDLAHHTHSSICPEHSFSGKNLAYRRPGDYGHQLHGDPKTMSDEMAAAKNSVRFHFSNDNGPMVGHEDEDNKENRNPSLVPFAAKVSTRSILHRSDEKPKVPHEGSAVAIPYLIGRPNESKAELRRSDKGYQADDSFGRDYLEMDANQSTNETWQFPEQGLIDMERSEMMVADLLNQCIVLGMQNMKESTDRFGEQNYLDRICPPSFLATAEEFSEYGGGKSDKSSPKLRRHRSKERHNVKLSPTKLSYTQPSEGVRKSTPNRERKIAEKDRSKTRTFTKEDFEEMSKKEENSSPRLFRKSAVIDESGAQSDGEKNSKQIGRSKTAIPIVKSKLPSTRSPGSVKGSVAGESAVGLHRQNTFNKEDSAIPVRKNSFKSQPSLRFSMPTGQDSSVRGIQARIKEPSPVVGRMLNGMVEKSPDFAKSRWSSTSESNLNGSQVLKMANGINTSATKLGSGLPVRRESSLRSASRAAYVK